MAQRSTDAPQNYQELLAWREQKNAYICDDNYLYRLDRKWRSIGRQARGPASLRNAEGHN